MFETFFYQLRTRGVPVSPTMLLRLHQALSSGLISDLNDFYVVARSLMVKRARHFDLYDQVFAHYFEGKTLAPLNVVELDEDLRQTLLDWLNQPEYLDSLPESERKMLESMTPDEVVQYFLDRLAEQTEAHQGGSRWIGTGGTSPVGHGGFHPGGMRVGGGPGNRSAVKVALDRRYIEYNDETLLTVRQLGDALRAIRDMAPIGPKDRLDVDQTIYDTVKNGGEIELVFGRRIKDKLNVFLLIDNGGWSMTPYVSRTRALFGLARNTFKQLRTFFFHNCIYDRVWEDPQRTTKPVDLDELLRADPDTRIIVMGDASMAPYELTYQRGAIDYGNAFYQKRSGFECLTLLADRFQHRAWVNPMHASDWPRSQGRYTIKEIRNIFPMTDLTLRGIEQMATSLQSHRR